jgi:hypothetical protein
MTKETSMDEISIFWVWTGAGAGIYVLICGALGAYASDERGRSGLEGFMFGLFLGPMGVVAAACMPIKERPPARLSFAERSALHDEARAKAALAQMEPKPRPVGQQARRLLGEVDEANPRRPKASE